MTRIGPLSGGQRRDSNRISNQVDSNQVVMLQEVESGYAYIFWLILESNIIFLKV